MGCAPKIVVVGVDGSEDSLAALAWAVDLVGPEGSVHAVHAVHAPTPADQVRGRLSSDLPADTETMGAYPTPEERLETWTASVKASSLAKETANITGYVVNSSCSRALLDVAEATEAEMVVVGSHGPARHRSRMVGAAIHSLLHDSDLPVAVVRSGQGRLVRPGRIMIVGIGSGAATAAALAWAGSFATANSLAVRLVHAATYQPRPVFNLERAMKKALEKAAFLFDPEELRLWAESDLSQLADDLRSRTGDASVNVTVTAELGRPGPVLVTAAEPSDVSLIVMGKHFDSPITGYFTTSSLHYVLTHSPCPVVVVPREHDRN